MFKAIISSTPKTSFRTALIAIRVPVQPLLRELSTIKADLDSTFLTQCDGPVYVNCQSMAR